MLGCVCGSRGTSVGTIYDQLLWYFDLNLTILELIPGCSRFVDIFTLAQKFTRQKCALQC